MFLLIGKSRLGLCDILRDIGREVKLSQMLLGVGIGIAIGFANFDFYFRCFFGWVQKSDL